MSIRRVFRRIMIVIIWWVGWVRASSNAYNSKDSLITLRRVFPNMDVNNSMKERTIEKGWSYVILWTRKNFNAGKKTLATCANALEYDATLSIALVWGWIALWLEKLKDWTMVRSVENKVIARKYYVEFMTKKMRNRNELFGE